MFFCLRTENVCLCLLDLQRQFFIFNHKQGVAFTDKTALGRKTGNDAPIRQRHGIRHVFGIKIDGGKRNSGADKTHGSLGPLQFHAAFAHTFGDLKLAPLIKPRAVQYYGQRQSEHNTQPYHKILFHEYPRNPYA